MDNGLGGVQTWVVIVVAVVTISISISFLINLFYLFGFKSVVSFICYSRNKYRAGNYSREFQGEVGH